MSDEAFLCVEEFVAVLASVIWGVCVCNGEFFVFAPLVSKELLCCVEMCLTYIANCIVRCVFFLFVFLCVDLFRLCVNGFVFLAGVGERFRDVYALFCHDFFEVYLE